jgi:hypothetical protein
VQLDFLQRYLGNPIPLGTMAPENPRRSPFAYAAKNERESKALMATPGRVACPLFARQRHSVSIGTIGSRGHCKLPKKVGGGEYNHVSICANAGEHRQGSDTRKPSVCRAAR